MPDLFYLQDSRSNVGSRAMFWRNGGGYTSNLDEAEQFTRECAVKQYECRETDLPWPVDYVCARAQVGVDHQYLERVNPPYSEPFYVSMPREWDGNDLYWKRPLATGGLTSNLLDAGVWESEGAELLAYQGYQVWPKAYIDGKSRRVVPAALLHHKQALRSAGLKLAKAKPQKARRYLYRCEPCGRFLTEYQNYTECPNCGAENRP
jgi:hypothetical protein